MARRCTTENRSNQGMYKYDCFWIALELLSADTVSASASQSNLAALCTTANSATDLYQRVVAYKLQELCRILGETTELHDETQPNHSAKRSYWHELQLFRRANANWLPGYAATRATTATEHCSAQVLIVAQYHLHLQLQSVFRYDHCTTLVQHTAPPHRY
jgi:hypothetical protein